MKSLAIALGALLLTVPAVLAASAVSSSVVAKADLEGVFYFNTSIEGGSERGTDLLGGSQLLRVVFEPGERFLTVRLAEDLYQRDETLVAEVARFPIEDQGSQLRVFWGDDPTPFMARHRIQTRSGSATVTYTAEGQHDIHRFEFDRERGYLTFVRNIHLVCADTGDRITERQRYNFLRQGPTDFRPKFYKSDAEFRTFGYFTSEPSLMADDETGYLAERTAITRIDVAKPFVFEIHPSIPEICHQPILDAIESWNDVFERRVGRRPLVGRIGEADHLPGDLRWHVIYFRMIGGDESGYSAYGPSFALNHTGEIVDADVVVEGTPLMGTYKEMLAEDRKAEAAEAAAAAAAAEAAAEASDETTSAEGAPGAPGATSDVELAVVVPRYEPPVRTTIFLNDRELPMVKVRRDTFRRGEVDSAAVTTPSADAGSLKAADRFYYLVRGLVCHEIGHCLGLRHNFGASTDRANFPSNQVSSSIMDYIEHDPSFYVPCPYDEAAIAFGYDGALHEGEDSRFLFLTDEDVERTCHPLANRHDAGDPFTFYRRVIDQVLDILNTGKKFGPSAQRVASVVDNKLFPIVKYINAGDDDRSDETFGYVMELLTYQFPPEQKYRLKPYVSRIKLVAGWYLLDLPSITGRDLTRRQRILVTEAAGAACADPDTMLEDQRIQLIERLRLVKHVTARKALEAAKDTIERRLSSSSLSDREAEVEENVLMHVEKALTGFFD